MADKFEFDLNYAFDDLEFVKPEVQQIRECCGVLEVGPFPTDSLSSLISTLRHEWSAQACDWFEESFGYITQKFQRTMPKKPTDKWFKDQVFAWVLNSLPGFVDGKVYLVTLIDTQMWLKPILKKVGFRLVSNRTVNRDSHNRIYIFLRDLRVAKGSKVKTRTFR